MRDIDGVCPIVAQMIDIVKEECGAEPQRDPWVGRLMQEHADRPTHRSDG